MENDSQHLFFGSGFAGPDLKLARTLLHEHLDAGDDGYATFAGGPYERRIDGVVNSVEDQPGIQFLWMKDHLELLTGHACGGGIHDHVEMSFCHLVATNTVCLCLPRKLLRSFRRAIQNGDVGAFLDKSEDCGAGGTAGAKDQDFGTSQLEAAFQRSNNPADIGIEAEEPAILSADDRIAGTDLLGDGIGLSQEGHDLLLERHGHGQTLDWRLMHQFEQVRELAGIEREEDAVDRLPTKGAVQHGRGERMTDGITGDAVNLGGCVDMLDPVCLKESTSRHLAGGCLLAFGGGGEGEHTAGAHPDDAADKTLFPHADANDIGTVACSRNFFITTLS